MIMDMKLNADIVSFDVCQIEINYQNIFNYSEFIEEGYITQ